MGWQDGQDLSDHSLFLPLLYSQNILDPVFSCLNSQIEKIRYCPISDLQKSPAHYHAEMAVSKVNHDKHLARSNSWFYWPVTHSASQQNLSDLTTTHSLKYFLHMKNWNIFYIWLIWYNILLVFFLCYYSLFLSLSLSL